jgi:hypothetical protein
MHRSDYPAAFPLILAALAALALATAGAGCAGEDTDGLLAPSEGPTDPGTADAVCPSVPVSVVRDQVPPQICVSPEAIPTFIMREVNGFWGSQVEVCRCGPDAAEDCQMNALSSYENGWIFYDPLLLAQLFAGGSQMPIYWMLGHEMGHEIQGHVTGVPSSAADREREADCLAGYFLGNVVCQGRVTESELIDALGAACDAGGGQGWFDPGAHGSCADRLEAVEVGIAGYLAGDSAATACAP